MLKYVIYATPFSSGMKYYCKKLWWYSKVYSLINHLFLLRCPKYFFSFSLLVWQFYYSILWYCSFRISSLQYTKCSVIRSFNKKIFLELQLYLFCSTLLFIWRCPCYLFVGSSLPSFDVCHVFLIKFFFSFHLLFLVTVVFIWSCPPSNLVFISELFFPFLLHFFLSSITYFLIFCNTNYVSFHVLYHCFTVI